MQQMARDEAGNVWEVDASGNPVRFVSAGQQAPQQMQVKGANPMLPYQVQQQAGQASAAPYIAPKAAAETRVAQAQASVAPQLAQAQALKAQAEAAQAQAQLAAASNKPNAAQQALGNDEVLHAIAQARSLVDKGGATGAMSRMSLLGGTSANDLAGYLTTIQGNLTLDNLKNMKAASPTGASGMGALSEKEGELLASTVASLDQKQSREKLLDSLGQIERHYRAYNAFMAGEDPRKPDVARKYGIALPEDVKNGKGDQLGLSQDGYRSEADPTLRGVNSHVRSMIASGKGEQVIPYLNSIRPGLGDEMAPKVNNVLKFRAQNPTVPLSQYTISLENKQVPLSPIASAVNSAAQSGLGAYGMNAAQALSGNTLDNMTSNPALARAGIDAVSNQHQFASPFGAASGTIIGAMGSEGAAAAARLGKFAAPIADAGYGFASGAGAADDPGDSRLTSGIKGAGWGMFGGVAGRGAVKGAGGLMRGVRDANVGYLAEQGVQMTPGQVLSQSPGVGQWFKGFEDRQAGFNGIGNKINNARRGSLEGFNVAADRQAVQPLQDYNAQTGLPPIQLSGQTGQGAAAELHQATNSGYNVLNGVTVPLDPQLATDLAPVVARGRSVPGFNYDYIANSRVAPYITPPGLLTGKNFQAIHRGLKDAAHEASSQYLGNDFASALGDTEGAFADLVSRHAPDVVPGLKAANTAYRNVSVLDKARLAAKNTDSVFTPAQLNTASTQNTVKFGGTRAAAEGNMPFNDLIQSGQKVLPNKVPDSGTAGREAKWYGRIGQNLFLSPLYNEGVQQTIQKMLIERPELAIQLGNQLNKKGAKRLGGMFGAGGALTYMGGAGSSQP